MLLKVKCAECEKEGYVLIIWGIIISRKWSYFPNFSELLGIDYWECKGCYEREWPFE